MFVNRFSELRDLEGLLAAGAPFLARVYGRRRLGKTELLRKVCQQRDGLYLHIDEADPLRIRTSLSRQIAQQVQTIALPYPDWDSFLDHLVELAPPVVVLDEFQRLHAADRIVVSRLQHRWDSQLQHQGPSLILCGSSIGMMLRLTDGRSAPLHGRFKADLRLRPFGYAAVRLLYPHLSEEDRVRRYAVFGGTPYYHSLGRDGSLEDAVRRSLLSTTAPLVDEPQSLLRLELQEPLRYNSILYELGNGAHQLGDLLGKLNLERGGLGPYLQVLQNDLDLLTREDPLCGKQRQARYVLKDPFFRFYYRFIFDNRPRIELGRGDSVWETIEGKQLDAFVGTVFEQIARQTLQLLDGTTEQGVKVELTSTVGRWWNRQGEELDLIAIGKRELIVGEVTWSRHPAEVAVLRGLQRKAELVEERGNRPVRPVIVSRGGWTDGLQTEARRCGCLLLSLADLSRIFDQRYGMPQPPNPAPDSVRSTDGRH